jgi:hypothetical protein
MCLTFCIRVMMYVTVSTWTRCSVRLCLQLFVGGIMSCLRCLCLLACGGVRLALCCVYALFFFVLCTLCCQFIWIAHFWFSFGVLWRLFFFILVTYTVNQVHHGNIVCLWIEINNICPSYIEKALLHLNAQMAWHIHSCTPISLTDDLTGIS